MTAPKVPKVVGHFCMTHFTIATRRPCSRGIIKGCNFKPLLFTDDVVAWLKVEACNHDYQEWDQGYAIRILAKLLEEVK